MKDIWKISSMKCYKLIFSILFSLGLMLSAMAQENRGYVEPIGKTTTFQPGDVFEGRLVLYPFSDLINEIKIEERVFLNHFYILKVIEIGFSENNHEALEVKFRSVIRESFDTSKSIQLALNKNYQIEFRNFKIEGDIKPAEEFHVLEHKSTSTKIKWSLYFIIGAIILFLIYRKWNKPSFLSKSSRKNQIKKFIKGIQNFKNREEFEKIYWDKYLWKEIVDLDNRAWKKLSRELNSIQFKKEWSPIELETMRKCFSEFIEEVKNGI
jgi:hypothetical protein